MTALLNNPQAMIIVGIIVLVIVIMGRRIDVRIGNMHAQLSPNGGESALDLIRKTNKRVGQMEDKVDAALLRIDKLEKPVANATIVVATDSASERLGVLDPERKEA